MSNLQKVISIALLGFLGILCGNKFIYFQIFPVKEFCAILFGAIISYWIYYAIYQYRSQRLRDKDVNKYYQLDKIFNNAPFMIFLQDDNGNILIANKNFVKSANLNEKQLIGMNINEVYKNYPFHNKTNFKQGKQITEEHYLEFSNGEKHWYKITKVPINNTLCKNTATVVFLINSDKEKQVEENKASFIATLTHDLKIPTLAQLQASKLLLKGLFGDLNNEQKEIITQIKNSCMYMSDLIITILDTYKYDNGQTEIKPEKFDMVELVNQITKELSNLLLEKGQTISLHSSEQNMYAIADKFQIKRVIVNFVSNAILHGFKDSTINIDINNIKSNIILNVKNKAKYIPEEKLKEIFVKFKHKENSKFHKTGTGLGLYLSKQIINAHNGKVYAKSYCNESCDFGFTIPQNTSSLTSQEPLKNSQK